MTAKAEFYTYVHRKADTGEVFYVGKGKGQRSRTIYNRTKFWRHVVAKHGFVVELVEFFDAEEDALKSEVSMIADYRSRGIPLVNLTVGGEGASGQVFTAERKQKISAALTGREIPEGVRGKISQSLKGRKQPPRSDEHKRRLSESQKGREFTDEHKEAIRASKVGIVAVFSAEARRKISEAGRGRIMRPETIEKLRIANLGNQHSLGLKRSEETKQRMRSAQANRVISDETRLKMAESARRRVEREGMPVHVKRIPTIAARKAARI